MSICIRVLRDKVFWHPDPIIFCPGLHRTGPWRSLFCIFCLIGLCHITLSWSHCLSACLCYVCLTIFVKGVYTLRAVLFVGVLPIIFIILYHLVLCWWIHWTWTWTFFSSLETGIKCRTNFVRFYLELNFKQHMTAGTFECYCLT